jgi:carboxypeptidase Taq
MVGLNRQLAEAIGYTEHPYDALLLQYEPGMTTSRLQDLFETLKAWHSSTVERDSVE